MANLIDEIMSQAQVFASAWSLVGGPFDKGDELENAQAQKAELRALVERAVLRPGEDGMPSFSGFLQRVGNQPVGLDWSEDAREAQR